jgi:hypothetical protein
MSRKAGYCENCNKSKLLYHIKKIDLTTGELKETMHWWCEECYQAKVDDFTFKGIQKDQEGK